MDRAGLDSCRERTVCGVVDLVEGSPMNTHSPAENDTSSSNVGATACDASSPGDPSVTPPKSGSFGSVCRLH